MASPLAFSPPNTSPPSVFKSDARDHDRVSRFIEQGALDAEKFEAILRRHGLLEKWRFQEDYPQP